MFNPEKYQRAWLDHIDELSHLALGANVEYHKYMEVRTELLKWIKNAMINRETYVNNRKASHE